MPVGSKPEAGWGTWESPANQVWGAL